MDEQSKKITNAVRYRVAKFMEAKGYNQSDITYLCDINKSFYYGEGDPNISSIQKIIARFPRLSLDYIMRGIMPMEIEPQRPAEPVSDDIMPSGITTFDIDANDAPTVAEPTRPYEGKRDENEMITIPASILADLRDQLKKKDQQLENCAAQIATLLTLLNK